MFYSALFIIVSLMFFYGLFRFQVYSRSYSYAKSIVFSLAGSIIFVVMLAFVFAALARYSLLGVTVALAIITAIQYGVLFKMNVPLFVKMRPGQLKIKWQHLVVGLLVLLAAILYLCFPANILYTNRDYGVYIMNGVRLSGEGGLSVLNDPLRALLRNTLGDNLIHESATYDLVSRGLSDDYGQQYPQFLPLFYVACALGFDCGSFFTLFRVNGLIALVGIGVFYYLCKELFSSKTALLSVLLLAFTVAQMWNARVPGSEMLSQLLLFMCLYVFIQAWKQDRIPLAILSGVLLGINCLCRLDTPIFVAAVNLLCLYTVFFHRSKTSVTITFSFSSTACMLLALLYGYHYTPYYFYGEGMQLLKLNLLLFTFLLACIVVTNFVPIRRTLNGRNWFLYLMDLRYTRYVIVIILGALAIYTYFIRPELVPQEFRSLNEPLRFIKSSLVEFCFYTTVAAIPLAIIGLFDTLNKRNPCRERAFLFILMGLLSLYYIYNPMAAADHFWVSRRWVVFLIPFLFALCAQGCVFLGKQISLAYARLKGAPSHASIVLQRCTSLVIVLSIITYAIVEFSPFIIREQLKGLPAQLERFSSLLKDDALYLTSDREISAPLRFIFDKPVYRIANALMLPESVDGRPVYFICSEAEADNTLNGLTLVDQYTIENVTYPQRTFGALPSRLNSWDKSINIYKVDSIQKQEVTYNFVPEVSVSERFSDGHSATVFHKNIEEPGEYSLRTSFLWVGGSDADLVKIIVTDTATGEELAGQIITPSDFGKMDSLSSTLAFSTARPREIEIEISTAPGVSVKLGQIQLDLAQDGSGSATLFQYPLPNLPYIAQNRDTNQSGWVSSGAEGVLAYGPYVNMAAGDYTVEYSLELLDSLEDFVGKIEICTDSGTVIRQEKRLYASDFSDGAVTFSLSFTQPTDSLCEFRVLTEEGTVLDIKCIRVTVDSLTASDGG